MTGNKGGGSEAEEEDEEELSALMARLKAAKPPAEVLKVCSSSAPALLPAISIGACTIQAQQTLSMLIDKLVT